MLGDILEKIDGFYTIDNTDLEKVCLSCETQLCATIHDILAVTDKDQSVHAAVLDFTKAFDRVPHFFFMEKSF